MFNTIVQISFLVTCLAISVDACWSSADVCNSFKCMLYICGHVQVCGYVMWRILIFPYWWMLIPFPIQILIFICFHLGHKYVSTGTFLLIILLGACSFQFHAFFFCFHYSLKTPWKLFFIIYISDLLYKFRRLLTLFSNSVVPNLIFKFYLFWFHMVLFLKLLHSDNYELQVCQLEHQLFDHFFPSTSADVSSLAPLLDPL